MNEHLIIIEDEKKLLDILHEYLSKEGYVIDTATDGIQGEDKLKNNEYDLALLDLNLPMKSGFEVLESIKSKGDKTPVLILSVKNTINDKLKGFLLGIDDYLTKPFDSGELLARIRAILNRVKKVNEIKLTSCDVELNLISRTIKRNNKETALSQTEFKLLEYFFKNKNQIITKRRLAEMVWGYTFDTGTNIVNVYINYVRKVIDNGFEKKLLRTIKGKGFILLDK